MPDTRSEMYALSCAMIMAPPWTAQAALDAGLVPFKLRGFAGYVAHFQKGVWSNFCLKFNTDDIETLYAAFGPPSEQDMMDMVSAMVTLHEKPRGDLRLAVSQLPTIRFFDQIIFHVCSQRGQRLLANGAIPLSTHAHLHILIVQ